MLEGADEIDMNDDAERSFLRFFDFSLIHSFGRRLFGHASYLEQQYPPSHVDQAHLYCGSSR